MRALAVIALLVLAAPAAAQDDPPGVAVLYAGILGDSAHALDRQVRTTIRELHVEPVAMPSGQLHTLTRRGTAARDIVRKLHASVIALEVVTHDGRSSLRVFVYNAEGLLRSYSETALGAQGLSADDLDVLRGNLADEVTLLGGAEPAPVEPAAAPEPATTPDAAPESAAEPAPEPAPQPAPMPAPEPEVAAAEESPPEHDVGLGAINGETFAYVRAPVDHTGTFQQVSASLWLRARPQLTEAASASVELTANSFGTGDNRFRLGLREAYVSLHKHGWLLRMGQQIIPWGSSDVVNPTDFLTARDYTFFVTDTEKTRIGALSVLASHAWSRVEATVVATPIFPTSVLLVPASALPTGVTIAAPAPVEASVMNTEVAGRLKVSGRRWDAAVIGFRGFNHTPEYEVVSADMTGATLRQTHHPIVAGGIDGSASLGKVVVRFEAAYVATPNPRGEDPTIQPSYLFGVLGVERPLGERLRVQAQGIVRAYPYWRAPGMVMGTDPAQTAAMRGVAAANALLLDYQDQVRPAATLRVAYHSEEDRFEAEIFAATNFIGADYLVRPLLGWRPSDEVMVQLGLEAYEGPRSRPLGALHSFSGVFSQLTLTF